MAAYIIERCVFKSEATPLTLGLSALVGLLPDLDSLIVLAVSRRESFKNKFNHHKFFTHTPLFYLLLIALLWMLDVPKVAALCGVLTWAHLFLDSWGTDDGIMWLWPLSRRQFSLFPRRLHAGGAYGLRFYRRHVRCARVMVPEVVLLVSGSILAWHVLG